MSYLGLDIGTSGCKAVVFEQDGRKLGSAYLEYSVLNPEPGFAELDSVEVMEKCSQVIKQTVKESSGSPVSAMSISSQGEAFTPVGDKGEIIGNGMISSDSRASELVAELSQHIGKENLYKITGHTPYAMFSLFKLYWLKKYMPKIWQASKGFYCFEDLFHLFWGMEPAISWPLAGRTMLFDVKKHQWSEKILQAVGLEKERLAKPLPTGALVGKISPAAAIKLGLNNGVKVYAGGHDQTIAALGAGVLEEGTAMYATGTVECICPVLAEPYSNEKLFNSNICCYDFAVPGKYTTVAYSLTGGNILQWFKNEFGQPEQMEAEKSHKNAYELLLDQLDDEPTGLLVLPYFTPTGTPYFDAHVKGAILGLDLTSTRSEILKALLEGVTFEIRMNVEIMDNSGMGIKKFIATGGGARSKTWIQLKANILNKPIYVTERDEAGCFGAAMIACASETGMSYNDLIIKGKDQLKDPIYPEYDKVKIYGHKFEKYKKLYPVLKESSLIYP